MQGFPSKRREGKGVIAVFRDLGFPHKARLIDTRGVDRLNAAVKGGDA
jgi:hypothetical protein